MAYTTHFETARHDETRGLTPNLTQEMMKTHNKMQGGVMKQFFVSILFSFVIAAVNVVALDVVQAREPAKATDRLTVPLDTIESSALDTPQSIERRKQLLVNLMRERPLVPAEGSDLLDGGDGDDWLQGGQGHDTLAGNSVILNENFTDGDFGICLFDAPLPPTTQKTGTDSANRLLTQRIQGQHGLMKLAA